MMLVAERNGLFFDDLNIGDVVSTIHRVGKGEEQPRSETSPHDADGGD
jgi:hypothetical protein